MPIKKHVAVMQKNNLLQIPKTLCDSLGLGENCPVRIYSNNNGYSLTVETVSTYESVVLAEQYKEETIALRKQVKSLTDRLKAAGIE